MKGGLVDLLKQQKEEVMTGVLAMRTSPEKESVNCEESAKFSRAAAPSSWDRYWVWLLIIT